MFLCAGLYPGYTPLLGFELRRNVLYLLENQQIDHLHKPVGFEHRAFWQNDILGRQLWSKKRVVSGVGSWQLVSHFCY